MALKFWTNQTVTMQSAIAVAQTITGITKANPGVVTTSGTLPTNGQIALMALNGMQQLNKRAFRVAGATGSTFNVGQDTTNYATFNSGVFQVVTMGLSFDSIRDIQSSGGDPVFEDTTTVHEPDDSQAIVSSSPQSFSFTVDWEPTNATLIALNQAFITRTTRVFSFADPDGSIYLFNATVSAPLQPVVSGKKKVTPVSLALTATGTAY